MTRPTAFSGPRQQLAFDARNNELQQENKNMKRKRYNKLTKLWIVHVHSFAVCILQVHSEVLEDLQSLGTVSYVLFQACCGTLSLPRRIQVVVTQIRKYDETVGISPFHHRQRFFQGHRFLRSGSPALAD
jgi:hypothetical protein